MAISARSFKTCIFWKSAKEGPKDILVLGDFKILPFQNPEIKIMADFKILAFQNPELKILTDYKILAFQNPEF